MQTVTHKLASLASARDAAAQAQNAGEPPADARATDVFHNALSSAQRAFGVNWDRGLATRLPDGGSNDDPQQGAAGRRIRELVQRDRADARSAPGAAGEPNSDASASRSAGGAGPRPPTDRDDGPSAQDAVRLQGTRSVRSSTDAPASPPAGIPSLRAAATGIESRSAGVEGSSGAAPPRDAAAPPSGSGATARAGVPSSPAPTVPAATSPDSSVIAAAGFSRDQRAVAESGATSRELSGALRTSQVTPDEAASSRPPDSTVREPRELPITSRPAGPADSQESAQAAAEPETDAPDPNSPTRASFGRLVQSIRTSLGARQSSARIRLDPPDLGSVRIDMKVSGAKVVLRLETETSQARELLASRLDDLRSALAQHGLTIDRVELHKLAPPPDSGLAQGHPYGHDPSAHPQNMHRDASRGETADRQPALAALAATTEPDDALSPALLNAILDRATQETRLDLTA